MNSILKRKQKILAAGAVALMSVALLFVLSTAGQLPVLLAAPGPQAADQAPVLTLPNFADIAERINPAVVYIESTEVVERQQMFHNEGGREQFRDPFWDFFFGPDQRSPQRGEAPEQVRTGRGSGVIIDKEGYILTNNHMVEDAAEIIVELDDGRRIKAELVGTDPATDLALIRIDPEGEIPVAPLGNSEALRIGEWVMAIGNPHNFKHTVSVGVVSAKDRQLPYLSSRDGNSRDVSLDRFIQTDAAINFGNSGGPLINTRGEVIGINTAISSMAQNIGFAVPVNVAKEIMPQLIEKGRVSRGYLGIRVTPVTPEYQELFNLTESKGAVVQDVVKGLPAEKAGLRHGDVIIRVNNREIDDSSDLVAAVSAIPPGETVALMVVREGKSIRLDVELAERDASLVAEGEGQAPEELEEDLLGLTVHDLNPSLRERYRVDEEVEGALVIGVKRLSPAGEADIREGDVIVEIFREKITSMEQYRAEIAKIEPGDLVLLYVSRGDSSFFKTLKIEED